METPEDDIKDDAKAKAFLLDPPQLIEILRATVSEIEGKKK